MTGPARRAAVDMRPSRTLQKPDRIDRARVLLRLLVTPLLRLIVTPVATRRPIAAALAAFVRGGSGRPCRCGMSGYRLGPMLVCTLTARGYRHADELLDIAQQRRFLAVTQRDCDS